MTQVVARYKDILVTAEECEKGFARINVHLAKGKEISAANNNALLRQVTAAIEDKIPLKSLDLSWATPFQQTVYREMSKIKPGKVLSYKQLAEKIGKPKAYRAVASACARNKLPILIPCHRVIASNGGLGGYSSKDGLAMKKYLLSLEGYDFSNKLSNI